MLIAYDSKTGNVKRFVNKINMPSVEIEPGMLVEEPFILVTYTTGFGQVPDKVASFLRDNHTYLRGVSASGNRNWGASFARSADTIASQYSVPIISKFELSGTIRDVDYFTNGVDSIAAH